MESKDIIRLLEETRIEFNQAVDGLEDAQTTAKPGEEQWCVLDCAEHVVTVEQRFLGLLEEAERGEVQRTDPDREEMLLGAVTDRSKRAQAPEIALPAGRFSNLSQAMENFNNIRARTLQVAVDRANDYPWLSIEHRRFGVLNGSELLIVVAGHSRRHAAQIRECRSTLGA